MRHYLSQGVYQCVTFTLGHRVGVLFGLLFRSTFYSNPTWLYCTWAVDIFQRASRHRHTFSPPPDSAAEGTALLPWWLPLPHSSCSRRRTGAMSQNRSWQSLHAAFDWSLCLKQSDQNAACTKSCALLVTVIGHSPFKLLLWRVNKGTKRRLNWISTLT